jgi:hypothetical protein
VCATICFSKSLPLMPMRLTTPADAIRGTRHDGDLAR